MNLDYFIRKLTLFCIFGEVNEQFIKAFSSILSHKNTTKQSYNNLYFDNH